MNEMWMRQVVGVLRIELRKSLFSMRAVPVYILAAFPLFAIGLFVTIAAYFGDAEDRNVGEAVNAFAWVYQFFILRFAVYFGCVWVFMSLIRGEVLDGSLHYYFLTPIRREVLAAAKYCAGVISSTLIFGATTAVSLITLYVFIGLSAGGDGPPLLSHLVGYVGTTLLACLGYGAVFFTIGLFLRNPIIPAILVFIWEFMNSWLPGLLKKASVVFYLQSVLPVPPKAEGFFAIIVEPFPPWLGIPGLLLFTAVVLAVAGFKIRRMEISYGAD